MSDFSNPYLLLTPGPLSTTPTVKQSMLRDWCTWDDDYNELVQQMRLDLVSLATSSRDYTCVPMQGSGTFAVEAAIGTFLPQGGKLMVMTNGAYGERIAQIARILNVPVTTVTFPETDPVNAEDLEGYLKQDTAISHVAVVHCETTTGILNDIERIGKIVKGNSKVYIVDAMSSFGGIPFDIERLGIDVLVSSSNKCIQGVPGFGFVIARSSLLSLCKGRARSLALDLYDQWETMEKGKGKWRFTSPTHVVRAFVQAIKELKDEGGVEVRYKRYATNQKRLSDGMQALGFKPLLQQRFQSPIITSFNYPEDTNFSFRELYDFMKGKGYVLYPGKISQAETFRIGNIGDVYLKDIDGLLDAMKAFRNR